MNKQRIVIVVDGGIVQSVILDQEADVLLIDYGTEGCEDNELHSVPRADGNGSDGAFVARIDWAEVSPGRAAELFGVLDGRPPPRALTDAESKQAIDEGWALFEASGRMQIERDDEREVLDSDLHAIRFVRARAERGSELHVVALQWHDQCRTSNEYKYAQTRAA